MTKFNRRQFFSAAAKTAGAATALSALPLSIQRALAIPAAVNTGTIQDIEHIVILMQENRSFDHYFGALKGVRGMGDRFPVPIPNGKPVWSESNGTKDIPPFHLDSATVNALRVGGTPHSYTDAQNAWNQGRFGFWAQYKTNNSMGYYERADVPFQYALAEAFTLCDAYHCILTGGTDSNRIAFWSGSNYNPAVRLAGNNCTHVDAEVNNGRCTWSGSYSPTTGYSSYGGENAFTWPTLPELLQNAGVTWRIYQDPTTSAGNWGGLLHGCLAFQSFRTARAGSPLFDNGMAKWTIADLTNHVQTGTLPQVSWIIPSMSQSEHPGGPSSAPEGAIFIESVLEALTSNPDVWSKTAFFITFDENDGFFDHIAPDAVPSIGADGTVYGKTTMSVVGEYFDPTGSGLSFSDTLPLRPYGMGPRVPMYVISPWTKGGWVDSQVFDHTSMGRFLEQRFGITVPAISPWHRAVAGDLTSCFDFVSPNDPVFPALPDTSGYAAVVSAQLAKPAAALPATPAPRFQEAGTRYSRALPYELHASSVTSPDGKVTLHFSNTGTVGAVFHVYDGLHLDRMPRRYTVEAGMSLDDVWNAATTDFGKYDLRVYGANGFVRMFKGTTLNPSSAAAPEVLVCYDVQNGGVRATLRNDGGSAVTLTVAPNTYRSDGPWSVALQPGQSQDLYWGLADSGNWYDFTVANATTGFSRRFSGRVEMGQPGVSDPAMATQLS